MTPEQSVQWNSIRDGNLMLTVTNYAYAETMHGHLCVTFSQISES